MKGDASDVQHNEMSDEGPQKSPEVTSCHLKIQHRLRFTLGETVMHGGRASDIANQIVNAEYSHTIAFNLSYSLCGLH